jgi:hypothetical protein
VEHRPQRGPPARVQAPARRRGVDQVRRLRANSSGKGERYRLRLHRARGPRRELRRTPRGPRGRQQDRAGGRELRQVDARAAHRRPERAQVALRCTARAVRQSHGRGPALARDPRRLALGRPHRRAPRSPGEIPRRRTTTCWSA